MAGPYNWDIRKGNISVGGVTMTGAADGDFLRLEPMGDLSSIQEGALGEATISDLPTRAWTATISMKECAELNSLMTSLYKAMLNGDPSMVDINYNGPQGTFTSAFCKLKAHPAVGIGREEQRMEWQFNCVECDMTWTGSLKAVDRFTR